MEDRTPRRSARWPWAVWLALALGVGALLLWLGSEFPDALSEGNSRPRLVYLLLLLAAIGGSAVFGARMPAGTALRSLAIWVAIGALVVLAYSFRHDFRDLGNRIVGELVPERAVAARDGSVTIRRSSDGHFRVAADIDGRGIRFLVDTGATVVALSPRDAERLGIRKADLHFGIRMATANGTTWSAPVTLGEIVVGDIRVREIEAVVMREDMRDSLLGLSFLNRLSGYEVMRDTMVLKP